MLISGYSESLEKNDGTVNIRSVKSVNIRVALNFKT